MRANLRRIFVLVRKELQMLLNDPQGRVLLVLPVIVQLAVFPLAATLEVKNATLAIYDQDHGPQAIELTQRLSSSKRTFSKIIQLDSETALADTIERQNALAAVRIPPDFSRKIARGEHLSLQVVVDGRRSNSAQIATAYIQQIAAGISANTGNSTPSTPPSPPLIRNWFNPNLDYLDFILPCLIALISTTSVLIVTTLSVAREREHGTFDQLLVSPFTPEMIMVGKIIPALLVASFQATLVLLASVFIYQIPFQGSLLMLYAGILVSALALAGVGLFISSVCSTQQQAFLGMFSFMMPAVILSGFATPVENMPPFLQYLSWINPVRHFMEVIKAIYLKNADLSHFASLVLPLFVIGIGTLTAACLMFRRRAT